MTDNPFAAPGSETDADESRAAARLAGLLLMVSGSMMILVGALQLVSAASLLAMPGLGNGEVGSTLMGGLAAASTGGAALWLGRRACPTPQGQRR